MAWAAIAVITLFLRRFLEVSRSIVDTEKAEGAGAFVIRSDI